jgi:hypothetical protein
VVGIDDWAWRRGHSYGTIVCDLERGCDIDLLPGPSGRTPAIRNLRRRGGTRARSLSVRSGPIAADDTVPAARKVRWRSVLQGNLVHPSAATRTCEGAIRPAIRNLRRRGGTRARSLSVRSGPIAADDGHTRMGAPARGRHR